jgi:creatinine amidohydrolase/Fe(II)-dependent formamide hydrolase-like protein
MRFPGSVSVSDETFARVAREVALSAIAAGFKTVVLMGDHGDGQRALGHVARQLDAAWRARGARVYYIGGAYYKEKQESRRYMTSHHRPSDEHAGLDDTSELMFIDPDGHWVRQAAIARYDTSAGVRGDPTGASAALGETFVNWKITAAVAEIRRLRQTDPGRR